MTSDEAALLTQAQTYVDEVWEEVIADIDQLVQVHSVEDKPHSAAGMPFGPAPHDAMTRALGIANRLGLTPHDCEGYIGYADLIGMRDDVYLATIAHADVVPIGTGWSFDSLRVTRKDGYILGRGVIDDKGPLVLSLYAAHFFARQVEQTGTMLPYTLRCIVGCNEETGMEDVNYYLRHFPEPAFCFSPDAVFPVICGEKGHFNASIESAPISADEALILALDGGTVSNAVPDSATALVRVQPNVLPQAPGIVCESAGTDDAGRTLCRIVAHGKGGHASMPEGTCNAIGILVCYLLENQCCSDKERPFLGFLQTLLADTYGQSLGVAATDDVFGPLTCIGGTIRTHDHDGAIRFVQTMDIRYPNSVTGGAILERVQFVATSFGCQVVNHSDSVPFYIEPDCDEIRALTQTYEELSGHDSTPIVIGGGTYARHFSRAVSFGPDDPNDPAPTWVGQEHGPNEGVAEQTLKRALVIYIVAIARLMRLSF